MSPKLPLPLRVSDQYFMCISHLSHACYMSTPSHTPLFDHPSNIWWKVRPYIVLSSSLCNYLQLHVTSSLLAPNILLSNLFWSTLKHLPLRMRDWFWHPYKIAGKIIGTPCIYNIYYIFVTWKMVRLLFSLVLIACYLLYLKWQLKVA
jgi:hypothetical protein